MQKVCGNGCVVSVQGEGDYNKCYTTGTVMGVGAATVKSDLSCA